MDPTREPAAAPLFSGWDVLPFAGLGGVWYWLQYWLPFLPDHIPSHWNAAGQINGWMAKESFFTFAASLTLGVWGLFFLIGLGLRISRHTRQQLGARALLPLRGILPLGIAVMAGICAPMASILGARAIAYGMGAIVLSLILGLIPLVRLVRLAPPIAGATESDYRWGGMVYWNGTDPRLWVEKRLGLGWTLNFAKPAAWVLLALLLLPVLILVTVVLTR